MRKYIMINTIRKIGDNENMNRLYQEYLILSFFEQLDMREAVYSKSYGAGKHADYGQSKWAPFSDLQGPQKAYFKHDYQFRACGPPSSLETFAYFYNVFFLFRSAPLIF
jgi:hypothetical protein